MKVALVHDWLTGMRGGEKVLEVLCERYPDAELFTLLHVRGSVSPAIERLKIHTSALQRLPGIKHYYRECLPLFPKLIERFDLTRFDLVISASHCVAKSAVAAPNAVHICYCLTPMRYAWDQFDAYFGPERVGPRKSALLRPILAWLARWDRATAHRVDRYLAISQYVARRIGLYYNRQSTIVYPPVDTEFYTPDSAPVSPRFLIVSALVPYKRIDLAMTAARQAGVPLTIVGDGPERAHLEQLAGNGIELVGYLPDEQVRHLYRTSIATILPGEEDFGIVPVEAQACGRPVVALARGGALDTVVPGVTGVLVPDLSVDALSASMREAATRTWDSTAIRRHAEQFSREAFMHGIARAADELMAAPPDRSW